MKKIVSCITVMACIITFALPAFAQGSSRDPNTRKIYGITNDDYGYEAFGDVQADAAWYPEKTGAKSKVLIPLLTEGFRDEHGGVLSDSIPWDVVDPRLGPELKVLKMNRVVPHIHVSKGYQYLESVRLVEFTPTDRNPAQAAIEVTFVGDFYSTSEFIYEFEVYLTLDKVMQPARETFGGRIANPILDIYKLDYVYIGDGQVAHAKSGTQMNLTLDLGNGVILHRDMFKNERYYGVAKLLPNEHQDNVTKAYSDIDTVIDIHSVDMKSAGAYITFEKELSLPEFYVYNLDGEYVGRSNEKLPYSARYYLAKKEVTIDPALIEKYEKDEKELVLAEAVTRFVAGGKEAQGVSDWVPVGSDEAKTAESALLEAAKSTTTTVTAKTTTPAKTTTKATTKTTTNTNEEDLKKEVRVENGVTIIDYTPK